MSLFGASFPFHDMRQHFWMAKNILKHWWFLQDNSVDSEKQLQMEEQKKKKTDEEKQEEKVGKEEENEEEETKNDTSEPQVDGLNGVYPWDQDLIVAHTYLMTIYI